MGIWEMPFYTVHVKVNLVTLHDKNHKSSYLWLTLPLLVTTEPKQVHIKGHQNLAQFARK